jgi:PAS domain S-box-containing protein
MIVSDNAMVNQGSLGITASTHILFINPDPVDARRIEEMPYEAGGDQHIIEETGSVDAAIDCLADGCAEIVLFNLPPGKSSLDDLRRIADAAPEAAIVVLEPTEGACDAVEAIRLGAQDVLPADTLTGPALARALQLALERSHTRKELIRQERRERSMFDSAPIGILRCLPDGTLVDANAALVDLLAYPDKGSLLATPTVDLLVDPSAFAKVVSRLKKQSIIRDLTVELKRYDGTTIWIDGCIRAIPDRGGRIGYLEAAVKDVTGQRRALAAIVPLARFPFENPNIVMRLSSGGEVLYANLAGSRFLEETDSTGAIPERWHEIVRQALQDGAPIQLAASYGERSFHFTFAPISTAGYVNVYASDITSLKEMGNALSKREQQLTALFENAQEAIILLDDDASCIVVNPAASRLVGYERDELIGLKPWDLVTNPDLDLAWHEWERFKRIGEYQGEFTIRRRDGVDVRVESRAVANIAPGLHLSILRDVTERNRAVEALRQSEQKFRSVIEQSTDGIMQIDEEGRVLDWNPALERMTGLPRTEALGEYVWDVHSRLMSPERRAKIPHDQQKTLVMKIIDEARSGSSSNWLWEYDILRPDGERRAIQNATFIIQDSQELRLGSIVRDITELKQAEATASEQRAIAEALQESTAVLNSTLDLDEVLRLILMTASRVVPNDGSLLVMIEDGIGQVSHCDGYYAEEGISDDVLSISAPVDRFRNWKQMADTGQPIVIEDAREYPGWIGQRGMEEVRAYLGAPIIHQGALLGFINLTSKSPAAFTGRHARQLKTFSDQAAIAIRNAKLYEAEQHRRRVAETLRQASAVLSSTLALDEVLNRMMEQLGEVLPYDSASVQQMEGGRLVIRAARGFEDSDSLIGQSFPITSRFPNMQVIETKEPLTLADPVKSYPAFYEDADKYQSRRIQTWLGIPLIASDQVIGLITLDRNEVKPYNDDEIKLAVAFANHAATALENARLYAELENYSSILVQAVHEATNELRQTLEHLQAILDNSPDTILLLAHNGTIETVNPAFGSLFGCPQKQAIGQPVHKLLDEANVPAFRRALDATVQQHVTQRLEATARCQNRGAFDVEIALAPIMEDERLLGIVCSLRDISAFKEIERMKDALVSTAAHELRTPLTTIQGFSELILTRDLGEDRQSRYLRLINQQSEQLASIVNDLLDVSRLESGHGLDLNPRPIDIAPIVYEAAEPFAETHPRHAFEFIGLNNAPEVHGDPIRLGQVVKNLVSNAVKYSPEGGPVIIRAQTENGSLRVSVQDEGIGINDEQMPHIFDKFYRADASNTAVSGTGLGLTICKLIVEGHGGTIDVESEYGRGSTFTFNLPLDPQPGSPA